MNKEEDQISYATHKRNIKKEKIVFVGEQYVGKTSIITRFIKDSFDTAHNTTIGIDFVSKNVTMDARPMRLQLWDTAGQQRFRSLIPSYLRDCQAAFVVFDLTNEQTYNLVSKWMDFIKENRGEDALIFVIGNKSDLQEERVIDFDAAHQKFKEFGVQYVEVSAKTGENIEKMFQMVCGRLLGLGSDKLDTPLQKEMTRILTDENTMIEKNLSAKLVKREEEKREERGKKLTKKNEPHRIKEKNCC